MQGPPYSSAQESSNARPFLLGLAFISLVTAYNVILAYCFGLSLGDLERLGYPAWKAWGSKAMVLMGRYPAAYALVLIMWFGMNRHSSREQTRHLLKYVNLLCFVLGALTTYFCWIAYPP